MRFLSFRDMVARLLELSTLLAIGVFLFHPNPEIIDVHLVLVGDLLVERRHNVLVEYRQNLDDLSDRACDILESLDLLILCCSHYFPPFVSFSSTSAIFFDEASMSNASSRVPRKLSNVLLMSVRNLTMS